MAATSSVMSSTSPHPIISQIREVLYQGNPIQLPVLFHNCMIYYREGIIHRNDYSLVVKFLGNDPDPICKSIYAKVILGISPLTGGSPERPPSPGYMDSLYSAACRVGRFVSDHIFNYNHPWKNQKYTLILSELRRNLLEQNIDPEILKNQYLKPLTLLQSKVIDLMESIFTEDVSKYPTDRERYQIGVIKQLRSVLEESELQTVSIDHQDILILTIRKIIQFRYTGVHIYEWKKQLVTKFIVEGRKQLFRGYLLDEIEAVKENSLRLPLEWQYVAIEWAPKWLKARPLDLQFNKLQGHLGVDFDPSGRNNVPFVSYQWGPLLNIRMGTPTIQPPRTTDQTTIAPEFAFFVRSLALNHEKLLYINLQINFGEGAEKSRTNQLKILNDQHPDELILAMLDMDSPFYYQNCYLLDEINLIDFRNEFYSHLTKQGGPYELLETTREQINDLFLCIEHCLFPNFRTLRINERKMYIDFFHALMVLTLLETHPVNYFTIVCKDGLDRAGTLNAVVRELIMIHEEIEDDPVSQEINIIGIHAPTIMTKKIAMLVDRRSRYLQLMERIYVPDTKERVRRMLQLHFSSRGRIKVESKPGQSLSETG